MVKVEIMQEIAPLATREMRKAMQLADDLNAAGVLIHMNTYGGLLLEADSIRTMILNSTRPVWVFIDNNAASAGALISIACNSIYMRKGANIGAATVVTQGGEAAPDKYQSYMRSMMRATAEARGRNPDIAQAMVDGDIVVEGVNEKGQVVTFTTTEAMKHGFCDGTAETIKEALALAGIENARIESVKLGLVDRFLGFLMNPAVSGILILIIIGGIYYELQTPGIGFPILASVVAALLYFAPLYLEGLAENWEILLFIVGLILLGVEIFVLPGFGVAGISGVLLIIAGLTLSLVRNVSFDFTLTDSKSFTFALMRVLAGLVGFVLLAAILGKSILQSNLFSRIVLKDTLDDSRVDALHRNTEESARNESLAEKEGNAITDLRPQGKIKLDTGDILPATTMGEFIKKGGRIKVIREEANMLLVRRV